MNISSLLLSNSDYYLVPLYLIFIFTVGALIRSRYIQKFPEYKYFTYGLFFKLIGVSAFFLIYLFYYEGGDTANYFLGTQAIGNLLIQDFEKGYHILFNTNSAYNSFGSFNSGTGFPPFYMWKDSNTFSVCRFTIPFYFLGSQSFIVTSFLTSCLSFIGIWKLYRLFNNLFPSYSKPFAYLILFLPTLIFWGGGIMKDSYVLGATCWITYNFHQVFILRKKILINVLFLSINLIIILNIKSYVIISLIPGMMLWLNSSYLSKFKNTFIKFLFLPILISSISVIGFFALNNLSSMMGVYGDVDSAIQQAQVIQEDLLRADQYGSNNYNIGELDGSVIGILGVAPLAIFTALFRPLFFEIGSPTMVFSAIENTILLIFTITILIRTNPLKIVRVLLKEPFLMYCFIFSIIFAFGVGVAGTNFGALVRYKTPFIPFFFSMIYILFKKSRTKNF